MCWPGRVLRISGDGDDRTGAKIKTQKIPLGFKQNPRKYLDQKLNWPQKDPLSNFRRITRLGYTGTTTNLQCFEHPKYICQIFLPQKTWNLKVQTQKTPCIIRVNWNPEYPPPPPPFSLDATLYLAILLFKLGGYLLSLFAGTCSKNRYYSIFITACYWQKKEKAKTKGTNFQVTKHYTVMIVTYEWPSYRIGFVGNITYSL